MKRVRPGFALVFGLLALLALSVPGLRAGSEGVVLSPGDILIADEEAFGSFTCGDPFAFNGRGGIFRIDRDTGTAITVSADADFEGPTNLALEIDPVTGAGADAPKIVVVDRRNQTDPAVAPAVLRVDPLQSAASNATVLAEGGDLVEPRGITVGRGGTIYVVDTNGAGAGKLIQIDPSTGAQTVLVSTTLVNPTDLVFVPSEDADTDLIFIADPETSGGTGTIYSFSQAEGLKVVVSGSFFIDPVGITADSNGDLYVADADEDGSPATTDKILKISDPIYSPSVQTVTQNAGGNFEQVTDVAVEADGNLVATDPTGALGGGHIVRVTNTAANYPDAAQTVFSTGGDTDPYVDALGIVVVPQLASAPVVDPDKDLTVPEDTITGLGISEPTSPDGLELTITVDEVPTAAKGVVQRAGGGAAVMVGEMLTSEELAGLEFAPVLNQNGAAGAFQYTVTDTAGGSASQVVTIEIMPLNDAPLANDQSVMTNEDAPLGITLTASDVDMDSLTYTVTMPPMHGMLSGTAPNLTYTPDLNYFGPDSFQFTANDGTEDSNTATISIDVTSVNDAPVADDQSVMTNEDTQLDITLTAMDVEDDPLTYTVTTGPMHGTLSGTAPNLTYTPALNYFGPDSFQFKANDGMEDGNIATISINVISVNDLPTISAIGDQETLVNQAAGPISFVVGDVETAPGSLTLSGSSSNTALVPDANITFGGSGANRTVTVTPAPNQTGTTTITVTVTDADMGSTPETFQLLVRPLPPVDDRYKAAQGVLLTVPAPGVLANDPPTTTGTRLAEVVSFPSHGTLNLNPDGSFTYLPNPTYVGLDSFQYRINDGNAVSTPATVTIGVSSSRRSVDGKGTIRRGASYATFDFAISSPNYAGAPADKLVYRDPSTGTSVDGTAFDGVAVTGQKATLFGRARLNGGPEQDFTLEIQDFGTPGQNRDRFKLTVGGVLLIDATIYNASEITIRTR